MLFIAHAPNLVPLCRGEGRGPAPDTATPPSSLKTFTRALRDPFALELSDGSEDVKDETAGRCRRVDILGQGPESCPACPYGFDDVEKVLQRPGKAIILGDYHHIALTELVDHLIELQAFALRSGDLFGVDALGTGALKSVDLSFKLLLVCRDAGISDNHAAMLP